MDAEFDDEPEDPDVPGYPDDPNGSEGSDPDYVVWLYLEPVAANGAITANGAANKTHGVNAGADSVRGPKCVQQKNMAANQKIPSLLGAVIVDDYINF